MTAVEREIAILDRVRATLNAEGFEVIIQPHLLDLPDFLQNLNPDAVAHRGNEHVVVEVVSRAAPIKAKLRLIRHALEGHPDWSLQTVWTSSRAVPASLEIPRLQKVTSILEDVDELLEAGHSQAGFLMCWAALEGLGRVLLPEEFQKPQTPGRLIEYLGLRGFISRNQASELRALSKDRNRLLHGELQTEVTQEDVMKIRDILRQLLDIAKNGRELD